MDRRESVPTSISTWEELTDHMLAWDPQDQERFLAIAEDLVSATHNLVKGEQSPMWTPEQRRRQMGLYFMEMLRIAVQNTGINNNSIATMLQEYFGVTIEAHVTTAELYEPPTGHSGPIVAALKGAREKLKRATDTDSE